jgi:hypothetical protein
MNKSQDPRDSSPARKYHPFRKIAVEKYQRQIVDTTPAMLPHWGRWRLVAAILAAIAAAATWFSISH